MRNYQGQKFNLVFGSPPYEDARTYGIGFRLKGQAWVDWMVDVVKASLGICDGLVAFVVEGRTRSFSYSGVPLLLGADLIRAGITLRKPPIFHRQGIPGSGGPDYLRNDYEFIICATNGGKLPWSDNTACGKKPEYTSGGPMTYRKSNGERVYRDPAKILAIERANPGNVIKLQVGGGRMGSPLAHETEAPFPELLAEFFIKSFCPPGGLVLDPFSGSGTTVAVAKRLGRVGVGIDVRESQVELGNRRLETVTIEQGVLAA